MNTLCLAFLFLIFVSIHYSCRFAFWFIIDWTDCVNFVYFLCRPFQFAYCCVFHLHFLMCFLPYLLAINCDMLEFFSQFMFISHWFCVRTFWGKYAIASNEVLLFTAYVFKFIPFHRSISFCANHVVFLSNFLIFKK